MIGQKTGRQQGQTQTSMPKEKKAAGRGFPHQRSASKKQKGGGMKKKRERKRVAAQRTKTFRRP